MKTLRCLRSQVWRTPQLRVSQNGMEVVGEADVVITVFNNQYSPDAAKLGRCLSYVPQVSWLNISPEKGVCEALVGLA